MLMERGQWPEALQYADALLKDQPDDVALWKIVARLHDQVKNDTKAAEAYAQVAKRSEGDEATAYWSLAGARYGRALEVAHAIDAFHHVVEARPNHAYANLCLAFLYRDQEAYEAALPYARWVIDHSDELDYWRGLYRVFRQLKLDEDGVRIAQRLHEAGDSDYAGEWLYWAQRLADWPAVEALVTESMSTDMQPNPFMHISVCDDEERNLAVARHYTWKTFSSVAPLLLAKRSMNRPLRIGYVSCDFNNHATIHLMIGVLEQHDPEQVDVIAYDHSKNDYSWYRERFEKAVPQRVDIHDLTDEQAARRIAEDDVDILVDLKGFTAHNRLGIFAYRPAPIQATYLGFPGTLGADFFDYAITDPIITPDSSIPYYTEALCRLPETYQCNDDYRAIAANPVTRADEGLPEDAFVFCSFNQLYKIDEPTFDTWMAILRDVPNSVLWLLKATPEAMQRLRQAAHTRGVSEERIVFAEKTNPTQHLTRIGLADLVVDTRIYNGHTTTADALWAGTPVVTAKGNHFASRVSASLLTACGLPELITHSQEEMRDLAITLATQPERLAEIRTRLAENRRHCPLFDTERFTRHLEHAYRLMAERYNAGEEPQLIDVPALPKREEAFIDKIRRVKINLVDDEAQLPDERVVPIAAKAPNLSGRVVINGRDTDLATLSDKARWLYADLKVVDQHIHQTQQQSLIVKTARLSYQNQLRDTLQLPIPNHRRFAPMSQDTITLDGVEYRLSDLSDAAKTQITNLKITDQEIAKLEQQLAIYKTARKSYAQALNDALPKQAH